MRDRLALAWASWLRFLHVNRVLVRHALIHLLGNRMASWPLISRVFPEVGLGPSERLRVLFEDLGGTFLKFGQMLALQPDILSVESCNALFKLLDKVDPFGFDQVEKTFAEDLERQPAEIFDSIDREPLATASIGQVHVAYLEGRKVAVKVQRPTVETDFAGDIRLMATIVAVVHRLGLHSLNWLIEPLGEFIAWTREELDYRNEGRYLDHQIRISRDNPTERVPEIFWAYTTRRILVLEFLEGVTLLDYLRARDANDEVALRRLIDSGFDPNSFARNIIDNFLGDAFRHGTFHADLHPANLMILPKNVVGYVDFGITGVLSHYSRKHLIAMTLGYTQGDLDGMCAAFLRVSETRPDSDLEQFREGLTSLSATWYEQHGQDRRLRKNFTLVMLDMLRLSRRTGILPERDVIKYIRSSIAIDGLITRFAPEFDVGLYLAEVCGRYLKGQAWMETFSSDRLAEWSSAVGNLLHDGGARAASFLELASGTSVPLEVEGQGAEMPPDSAMGAFRLAMIAFCVAWLITMTAGPSVLSLNLFTAELLIVAISLTLLSKVLRRAV